MKIGVAGSMQYTEKMVEIVRQLEALGRQAFTSAFADKYIGKTDDEKEALKLDHNTQIC